MDIENTGFDLLKLYKDSLVRLTLEKEKAKSIDQNIYLPLMRGFLLGEEIPFVCEKEYISPFLLHDLVTDSYYPFCFFKIERTSSTSIKRSISDFCCNSAALISLKENGISFHENSMSLDIGNLYSYLQEKISSQMLMNKFEWIPYLMQCDKDYIEYSSNFEFLNDYIYNFTFDGKYKKYDALFKEIKEDSIEKKIESESFGCFSSLKRAISQADAYTGVKVRVLEPALLDAFVNSFLLKKKKEKILFVSKDKKELKSLFSSSVFMKLACKEDVIFQIKETEAIQHERRKRQLLSFENKREECYSFMKQFKDEAYLEELPEKKTQLIPLDFSGYTKEDYIRDKDFFSLLDSLNSLKNSTLLNHPYYGLYANKDKTDYDALQLLLMKLVKEIEELISALNDNEIFKRYNLSYRSLSELSVLIEDEKILSRYNGFPKKYFTIQPDMENKYPLSYLKHSYQSLSSSKLLISNFCKEDIFSIDLKKYISYYESKNIIKKTLARNKILSYVKEKKDTDLNSLVRVLKSYLSNEENLKNLLPLYVQIYGDSITNMNGVVEIESNISYINQVREYQKRNPSFDLEEPFYKRCFKDKDFRISFISFMEDISKKYNVLCQDMKTYQTYYREIAASYFFELSFDNLLFKFQAERLYRYDDFREYCLFCEKKREASSYLNLAIQRYRRQNISLASLKDNFIYSLVYFFYQKSKESFKPFEEDYKKIKQQFYADSKNEKEYQDSNLYNAFKENSMIDALKIVSKDELYSFKEDEFDYILIFDSSNFTNEEILSCYRISKHHIFIENNTFQDKRILGYHENVLTLDSLLRRELQFSSLDERLLSLLKEDCKSKGISLQVNGKDFPLSFTYKNHRYGLLLDVLLTPDMNPEDIMELRDFLSIYEDMTLIVLDTYSYLFKDETIFDFL